MSQNFNITMKQYNGTDYDVLYPATVDSQIDLSSEVQNYYPNGYTFEDVLVQNAQRTEAIGTVRITTRDDLDSSWVPCDGSLFDDDEYPELTNVIKHDITDTFLQTTLNLPTTTQNTVNFNSCSYCNNKYIFVYSDTTTPNRLAVTESLLNPDWTDILITNINPASLEKIIYIEDLNMYFASTYFNNMKTINTILYKSTDLQTWSTAVPGDGQTGIYVYSPSDKCMYKLSNVLSGSYYNTVLYKTSDFSSWEQVYSDTSSLSNPFSLSIVASNKYIYFSRLWNSSSYSKWYVYDIESGQVVFTNTPPSGQQCVNFIGQEGFVLMLVGGYINNTVRAQYTYYNDGSGYNFIKIDNLGGIRDLPNFIKISDSNYIVYTLGSDGISYSLSNEGKILTNVNNVPYPGTKKFSYDGKLFYNILSYTPNSNIVNFSYTSNAIPLLIVPNATAYIKAAPTPATTT